MNLVPQPYGFYRAAKYVPLEPDSRPPMTIYDIVTVAASVTGIAADLIKGDSRVRQIVDVRHMVCFIGWHWTQFSLRRIGGPIGMNYSSVIHGRNHIADLIENEPRIDRTINTIMGVLKNRHHLKKRVIPV